MYLTNYREALQQAEGYRQLRGRLWEGGVGSIVFGCLMLVWGLDARDAVCAVVGFWIIGAVAIAEGIWVIVSPRPAGLLAEAAVFLVLAFLNAFVFVVSLADETLEPDIVVAALGVLQVALAIWYLMQYRKFSWVRGGKPPMAVTDWIGSVAGIISESAFRDSPYLVTFRRGSKHFKAALTADTAIIVQAKRAGVRYRKHKNGVQFAAREDVRFIDQGKELTTDRRKGRLTAGNLSLRVSVSPASLKRLEDWLAATPDEVEAPANLPEPPFEDLEGWRLDESYMSSEGDAEAFGDVHRDQHLLAELALPPDHPTSVPGAGPPIARARWSGAAIASLVLGLIVCLGPFTALPAVILGHLSLRKIGKARGGLRGRGLAITGLVIGYSVLAFSALVIALSPAFIEGMRQGWEESTQQQCAGRLKILATACRAYAAEHEGRFPDRFSDLYPEYVDNPNVFACPATWEFIATPQEIDTHADYILEPGCSMSDPPETILIHEPADNHSRKGYHVVHLNGHVEWRALSHDHPAPTRN